MKKFIVTMLALSLVTTSLVGCGTEKKLEKKESNRVIESVEKNKDKKEFGNDTKEKKELEEEEEREEVVTEAMYVPINDSYVFINEQVGPFTIVGDEYEILDVDGQEMSFNELTAGNTVEITSDGVMMESYPGQLANVSKVVVMGVGTEDDVKQYQDIINQLSGGFEGEESKLPTLSVLYTTSMAVTSVNVNSGGYQWKFYDENEGQMVSEIADEAPVRLWGDRLMDVVLEGDTDLRLSFSEKAQEVSIKSYSSEWIGNEEELVESETATVIPKEIDGDYIIEMAEKDLIYEITATFEDGTVNYGFYTK